MHIEKERMIGVPRFQRAPSAGGGPMADVFGKGNWVTEHVPQSKVVAQIKRCIDQAPTIIAEMKKADNEGWQAVLDELLAHANGTQVLHDLIRHVKKDGKEGVSIGNPNSNWVSLEGLLLINSFFFGYAIGTWCFNAGYCNFVAP